MSLDFVSIKESQEKRLIVYPDFMVRRSKDLMIRGKTFYAIWDEERNLWSKDEEDVQRMVDNLLYNYVEEKHIPPNAVIKTLGSFGTNKWSEWQKYCKSMPDRYVELDEKVIFSNHSVEKKDYATRTLDYPIEEQDTPAFDELMDTLYDPEEREKLEWAIGSIISGESKKIQKFMVLYGGPGTGKSTVLNIIQDMFPGYWSLFESKELGSNGSFGLESLKNNPLIAIEHDGDLSRIEDNTRLNSIISHEKMVINEKYKSKYEIRFKSFLFMGTNKPVKITDSKSGLLRRLIDVTPTGKKIPRRRFDQLMNQIRFEYPGIAQRCLDVFRELGATHYDKYIPTSMMVKTNDFYNFIEDNLDLFLEDDHGIALNTAWMRYKAYCEDAEMRYIMNKRVFKDELKNYFADFQDRYDGQYNVYIGFQREKFKYEPVEKKEDDISNEPAEHEYWLDFDKTVSEFDDIFKDCPAQYATGDAPTCSWAKCKTKLSDLNTSKVHYVRVPENLIVIDFDLKNENGEKDYQLNLEEARKWPPTYAELSKSGSGIHLHYYYDGDPKQLSRIFGKDVEIKTFRGKSSLRRMLTLCNAIPIAMISSGLPLREVKSVVSSDIIKSERSLREMIKRNLRKEIHPNTKPSMDFIYKILEDAYASGMKYDVRDLRPAVQAFAMSSTHQADYCMRLVSKMEFCSEEPSDGNESYDDNRPIVFYDVEVFSNLFIIVWKKQGDGQKVVKMINPKPSEVEELTKFRLIGFNNRKYDNHILYARMMGYTEEQLYNLSQRIIGGDKEAFFGEAYNLSYTDIYDFLSAGNKMSLKKWEIQLGIHHQELGLPWDKPVPKERWEEVADYCCNDVIATEAVFDANQADWVAREVLADWAGLTRNDTTNACTTRIIVGTDRNPQSQFIYTDLSTIFPGYEYDPYGIDKSRYNEGAKIVRGKSIYRGEDPGEGGRVYAEPGMYAKVAVLDVASMHPHSAIRLMIFGEEYTAKFENIVEARVMIKHKDFDGAKKILEPRLHKYLDDPAKAKALANALKTAINSVYGLTSATFPNKLKDPRNKDNIVAKYGALFMINLQYKVQARGYTVVHIKTDSIKIANADNDIIQFVNDYGKEYGYTFEHEATYEKICLVNDAVYIAQYADKDWCQEKYGYIPGDNFEHSLQWTATGTQFQIPYVFKTLFSGEEITFSDICETKSVTTALYLDMNEGLGDDEHDYRFVGKVGSFCPVKDGVGGGILLREGEDKDGNQKFSAATGTKKTGKNAGVYRWMEAEMVEKLGLQEDIDLSYYNHLCDDAIDTISQYGDFERFCSGDISEDSSWINDEMPFDDAA